MISELFSPLLLRSGQVLKNRIAKAAKSGGGVVRMQIDHPGRQAASDMPGLGWGPPASASAWASTAAASAVRRP
ncbi:hypothetical protein ACF1CG_34170 [Streptomyces sp. NPDC014773]|uniref:hypothetical protein n=1 Tax=Streptomyces sp. NPDC014773 TaxID=3364908 RepID=UPI0036F8F9B1